MRGVFRAGDASRTRETLLFVDDTPSATAPHFNAERFTTEAVRHGEGGVGGERVASLSGLLSRALRAEFACKMSAAVSGERAISVSLCLCGDFLLW